MKNLTMYAFIVFLLFFSACSNESSGQGKKELENYEKHEVTNTPKPTKSEPTSTPVPTLTSMPTPTALPTDIPKLEYINGFEKAEYEKFNSPAEENGLGGTKVYISGRAAENVLVEEEELLVFTLIQDDGKLWLIGLPVISESEEFRAEIVKESILGKNIEVYGVYEGLSETLQMPAAALCYEGTEIRLKKENTYETVWNFDDCAKEKVGAGESDEEVLASKEYEISCGKMLISLSKDKQNEYYFKVTLEIEESWKAATAYIFVCPILEDEEIWGEINTSLLVVCEDVFLHSSGLLMMEDFGEYTFTDASKWAADNYVLGDFSTDESKLIMDEITECIVDFMENV